MPFLKGTAADRRALIAMTHDDETLIEALIGQRPSIQHATRDPDAFPCDVIDTFRKLGVLTAPLPRADDGLGWGTEADANTALCAALREIGYANLGVGRIYEAHVNALALIFHYGDRTVQAEATAAARDGHLFALWVAPAEHPVTVTRRGSLLHVAGRKAFCTAAGYATRSGHHHRYRSKRRANDLARRDQGEIDTRRRHRFARHAQHGDPPGDIRFEVPADALVGDAGDYLREPDFSAGAWRTQPSRWAACAPWSMATIMRLPDRRRHTNPHQAARIGRMLIQCHTAEAWINAAALRSESRHYVGLARLAIEAACLQVIPLVQRSLGLSCFLTGDPIERLMRDLATYLRQPAAD